MSSPNDEHLGPLDIKSAASDVLKDMMEDVQLLEEIDSIRQVTPVDIMSWSTHVVSIFTAQGEYAQKGVMVHVLIQHQSEVLVLDGEHLGVVSSLAREKATQTMLEDAEALQEGCG